MCLSAPCLKIVQGFCSLFFLVFLFCSRIEVPPWRLLAAVLGAVSVACHTVITQEQCLERIASHDPFDLILLVSPSSPYSHSREGTAAFCSPALAMPWMVQVTRGTPEHIQSQGL